MNKILLILLAIGTLLFTSFNMLGQKPHSNNLKIVELFTSQGCSSCPAADRLLSEIADNDNVIALSFHVSYWNYLGWKDPYSDKQFTERQREYAAKMHLQSIYTPQIVINGTSEFVGSDKSRLAKEVNQENDEKSFYEIIINDLVEHNGILHISYSITDLASSLNLNIAIVERNVENYVPKGENRGRTLKHDNVVRIFKTIPAESSGQVKLTLPKFTTSDKMVVLYIQDENLKIHGGLKVEI